MANNLQKLVIIDTDCGIDDAMAIMLATYCQKKGLADILAITCTHGNTTVENVVKNVCLTLRASDLESIKIYKGCADPIIGRHIIDPNYPLDGLGDSTKYMPIIDIHMESESAVNALVRLVKQYPKQVTLLALGPLTNIALAYQLDNEFFDNLDQIVYMGGTVAANGNMTPTTEFNVFTDPEACHVMLTKASCPITLVPWECGLTNQLTWDIYDKIGTITTEKAKFLHLIMAEDYQTSKSHPDIKGFMFCDILVVVAYLFPELIQSSETHPTSIELSGNWTRGQLIVDRRSGFIFTKFDANKVKFITHFDQTKLLELLIDMIK